MKINMWDNMKYRDMFDDFKEDELERAFKKGCEHGYKKAMEEMKYSERGNYGQRSWTISEGYGHREDDDYSERRGRRSM